MKPANSQAQLAQLFNEAIHYQQKGQFALAEKSLRQALKHAPQHPEILHALGLVLHQQGQTAEAIKLLKKAIANKSDEAIYHNNLGNLLNEQGNIAQAITAYRAALRHKPNHLNALYNLACLLEKQGDYDGATQCLRHLVKLAPQDAQAWNQLGSCLLEDWRYNHSAEAIACYQKAVQYQPNYADAWNNLGIAYMDSGNSQTAIDCYRQALRCNPQYARAYENLARAKKFTTNDTADLIAIENLLENKELDNNARLYLHSALGKIYDDLNQYPQAFHHYQQTNQLKQQTIQYDYRQHSAWIDEIIQTFNADFFQQHTQTGNPSTAPVFIIGMMRSGTSLVEQILASHPLVYGAGELNYLPQLAQQLPQLLKTTNTFPACIAALSANTCQQLADTLLHRLHAYQPQAQKITDKLPANYLYLGLIYLLFPNATIIHCQRDPFDTCLSIYFQRFSKNHPYAYDLTNIAHYYQDYQRLMQHWQTIFPAPIHTVDYENLLANQENVSRQLVAACGLEWDEHCLNYHQTTRTVRTASHWQVRQPVYKSSLARWKHYEPYLKPLKEILE
ncbi:tetratricopeptide repeat protein,tetratricopeptide repeat protein,sulfotransferase family protein [Beggiatoa alba B18LD]|uniref:Tetratricopeptide repeat protein,tetratricopeptide repeat protein,sulfotransferase family protein n=1 Tax=Beggiatoa alba B18LD TaxID=395493 RepID=I3CEH4_9GAMM|nr:tetratricopeptide repeat-containing sulfotransferase family protein [Beggiatoa alba]EIJ42017.1 tetratricopeptide repeat protein,tetratricopeptide repeat protein,sulfotransferase family protein [Beggiatoa alba B18LD]